MEGATKAASEDAVHHVCQACHGEGYVLTHTASRPEGTNSAAGESERQVALAKRAKKLRRRASQLHTAQRFCQALASTGTSTRSTPPAVYAAVAFVDPSPTVGIVLIDSADACSSIGRLIRAYNHIKDRQLPALNTALGTDFTDFIAAAVAAQQSLHVQSSLVHQPPGAAKAAAATATEAASRSTPVTGGSPAHVQVPGFNVSAHLIECGYPKLAKAVNSFFKGGVHVFGAESSSASVETLSQFFMAHVKKAVSVWSLPRVVCLHCNGVGLLHLKGHELGEQFRSRGVAMQAPGDSLKWKPRVAIVGGGIAGCAAALALRQRGLPATVFERDNTFGQRKQGYGLTMQQGSQALTKLGLQLDGKGVSSTSHFMFDSKGEILGYFGRRLNQRSCSHRVIDAAGSDILPLRSTRHDHGDENQSPPLSKRNKADSSDRTCIHETLPTAAEGPASTIGVGKKNKFQDHNVHLPRQDLRLMLIDALRRHFCYDQTQSSHEQGANRLCHPQSDIAWGSSVKRLDYVNVDARDSPPKSNTQVLLSFRDHSSAASSNKAAAASDGSLGFDLVIGCDGIYSRIRRQLLCDDNARRNPGSSQQPQCRSNGLGLEYLGIMVVLGITDYNHPLLDHRIFETVDGSARLFAMPFDQSGRHMWQLSWRLGEEEAQKLSRPGAAHCSALKAAAQKVCAGWHAPIPEFLASTPLEMMSGHPVFDAGERFIAPTNLNRTKLGPCVVLLGDASHPMSPFKGQGANQALLDAVELAQCVYRETRRVNGFQPSQLSLRECMRLFKSHLDQEVAAGQCNREKRVDSEGHCHSTPLEAALREFEQRMAERVIPKIRTSRQAIDVLHSPSALRHATSDPEANESMLPACVTNTLGGGGANSTRVHAEKLRLLRDKGVTAEFDGDLDDAVLACVGVGNVPSVSYSVKVHQSRTDTS